MRWSVTRFSGGSCRCDLLRFGHPADHRLCVLWQPRPAVHSASPSRRAGHATRHPFLAIFRSASSRPAASRRCCGMWVMRTAEYVVFSDVRPALGADCINSRSLDAILIVDILGFRENSPPCLRSMHSAPAVSRCHALHAVHAPHTSAAEKTAGLDKWRSLPSGLRPKSRRREHFHLPALVSAYRLHSEHLQPRTGSPRHPPFQREISMKRMTSFSSIRVLGSSSTLVLIPPSADPGFKLVDSSGRKPASRHLFRQREQPFLGAAPLAP